MLTDEQRINLYLERMEALYDIMNSYNVLLDKITNISDEKDLFRVYAEAAQNETDSDGCAIYSYFDDNWELQYSSDKYLDNTEPFFIKENIEASKISLESYPEISEYEIEKWGLNLNIKDESIGISNEDVLQWQVLLTKLKKKRSLIYDRIYNSLPEKCQDILDNWEENDQIGEFNKQAIIKGLNQLLKKADFYQPELFEQIDLSKKVKDYISRIDSLNKNEIQRFNRLLLEDMCPDEIFKSCFNFRLLVYPINLKIKGLLLLWKSSDKDIYKKIIVNLLNNFTLVFSLQLRQFKILEETVEALGMAIDCKDQYTERHSQNVKDYAVAIAEKLKEIETESYCCKSKFFDLSDEDNNIIKTNDFIFNVKIAALLHDIGKIGIPECIIKKPFKLDEEEYGEVQKHVEHGLVVSSRIPLSPEVHIGIFTHHLSRDGKVGYPNTSGGGYRLDKLRDIIEKTPVAELRRKVVKYPNLIGKILAVADSFDTIISRRDYKVANSIEYALLDLCNKALKETERKGKRGYIYSLDVVLALAEGLKETVENELEKLVNTSFGSSFSENRRNLTIRPFIEYLKSVPQQRRSRRYREILEFIKEKINDMQKKRTKGVTYID